MDDAVNLVVDQLVSMGIPIEKATLAVRNSNPSSPDIGAALDWIESHPDPPPSTTEQAPSQPASTATATQQTNSNLPTIPAQTQKPSIRCCVCGIAIFGEAHATRHATQTKHQEFEEYIPLPGEEPTPPPTGPTLTEEEKLQKLEELRKKNEIRREQKKIEEEKEQMEREKKRRADAKEMEAAKQKWKEEQERKRIEEEKREKMLAAKQLEEIRKKISEDKMKREGGNPTSSTTASPVQPTTTTTTQPVQATASTASAPTSTTPKSVPAKCTLTVRLSNGSRLEAEFNSNDTLKTVFDYVTKHRTDGSRPFNLLINFPKKLFTTDHYNVTLIDAELVPRAMLILTPK